MANKEIFFNNEDSPEMMEAFKNAQETFKYFWREVSWEYRRIIPGLTISCVKVKFSQNLDGDENPTVEYMWIDNIDFDGEQIRGILINDPRALTNIKNGDAVTVPLNQISDWLFGIYGRAPKGLLKIFSSSYPRAYGGFTMQVIRSEMTNRERKSHDKAWDMDFGDFKEVLLVYEQKENPENLIEHPMSRNGKETFQEFLKEYPNEIVSQDEEGFSLLHRETIAGNGTSVAVLLEHGADRDMKTNQGKTALDFAKQLKWEHLISILSS